MLLQNVIIRTFLSAGSWIRSYPPLFLTHVLLYRRPGAEAFDEVVPSAHQWLLCFLRVGMVGHGCAGAFKGTVGDLEEANHRGRRPVADSGDIEPRDWSSRYRR